MLISVEGNSKCLQSPAKMCCFSEKLKNIHALLDLVHVWKGKETTSWRCRQTDHNSSYYKAISQLKINSSSFDHIRYKPNIEIYICFSFSSNSAIPPSLWYFAPFFLSRHILWGKKNCHAHNDYGSFNLILLQHRFRFLLQRLSPHQHVRNVRCVHV